MLSWSVRPQGFSVEVLLLPKSPKEVGVFMRCRCLARLPSSRRHRLRPSLSQGSMAASAVAQPWDRRSPPFFFKKNLSWSERPQGFSRWSVAAVEDSPSRWSDVRFRYAPLPCLFIALQSASYPYVPRQARPSSPRLLRVSSRTKSPSFFSKKA